MAMNAIEGKGYFALDTNTLPWEQRSKAHLPAPIFRKILHTDPETGVFFQIVKYPAGVINPSHTHPCAHAIYVLEGTLVTHRGRYGPGTFVWFPEGEVMEHALTKSLRIRNEAIKSLCASVRRFRYATIKEECKRDYPHALQALWKALDRVDDLIQN